MKTGSLREIYETHPYARSFFEGEGFIINDIELSPEEAVKALNPEELKDRGTSAEKLIRDFYSFIKSMEEFLGTGESLRVKKLSIIAGRDKSGNAENFGVIEVLSSQTVSIVGPTGSGKSRLLQDIEWTADGDTPTGRRILINGKVPDKKRRYRPNDKLVAQLSQNMNFVMDVTVRDFLTLHAESRMAPNPDETVHKIICEANSLAGEPFKEESFVTALSGGQSRALMIADTAILSRSPIVLIDEIENAGVDRKKALELLVSKEKIVLISTHDPILALNADKRIVINNGAIIAVHDTNEREKEILRKLETYDDEIQRIRAELRCGARL